MVEIENHYFINPNIIELKETKDVKQLVEMHWFWILKKKTFLTLGKIWVQRVCWGLYWMHAVFLWYSNDAVAM